MLATLTLIALFSCPQEGQSSVPPQTVWELLEQKYDANKDGQISPKEHGRGEKAFGNLDRDGDGVITKKDTEAGGRRSSGQGRIGQREKRKKAGSEPKAKRLDPPKVGQKAPDFELLLLVHNNEASKTEPSPKETNTKRSKVKKKPEQKVKLSSFVGIKPVALIFGSYT